MDKHANIRVYERANIYPQCLTYYLCLMRVSFKTSPFVPNKWEVFAYKKGYIWWARDVDYLEQVFSAWLRGWLT